MYMCKYDIYISRLVLIFYLVYRIGEDIHRNILMYVCLVHIYVATAMYMYVRYITLMFKLKIIKINFVAYILLSKSCTNFFYEVLLLQHKYMYVAMYTVYVCSYVL